MFNQLYGVHITSLDISSLGADTHTHTHTHTYTHTHTHTYRHPHRNNFKKPGMRWPQQVTNLNQSLTRNIYPMHHPVLATVITQSQVHIQRKHSLVHLQDLIPTLAAVLYQPV